MMNPAICLPYVPCVEMTRSLIPSVFSVSGQVGQVCPNLSLIRVLKEGLARPALCALRHHHHTWQRVLWRGRPIGGDSDPGQKAPPDFSVSIRFPFFRFRGGFR